MESVSQRERPVVGGVEVTFKQFNRHVYMINHGSVRGR